MILIERFLTYVLGNVISTYNLQRIYIIQCAYGKHNLSTGYLTIYSLCCAVLSCSVVSDSLRPCELQPVRLLCPWGFSRQEYWSGLPYLPPGDLPNPRIEPMSPALQADTLPSEPPQKSTRLNISYWNKLISF